MDWQLNAFVMLDGEAAEAIAFYERTLGAKTVFRQSYGEGPADAVRSMSEEERKRIAHAVLKIGNADFFVADSLPGKPLAKGESVNLCVSTADPEAAARLFAALGEGGRVLMPLEPVYFSPAYGMLTDKFGVTFQIAARRKPD